MSRGTVAPPSYAAAPHGAPGPAPGGPSGLAPPSYASAPHSAPAPAAAAHEAAPSGAHSVAATTIGFDIKDSVGAKAAAASKNDPVSSDAPHDGSDNGGDAKPKKQCVPTFSFDVV